jgi:hypothetical protein
MSGVGVKRHDPDQAPLGLLIFTGGLWFFRQGLIMAFFTERSHTGIRSWALPRIDHKNHRGSLA